MKVTEVLSILRKQDVMLKINNGKLFYASKCGVDAQLTELISTHKDGLIAYLDGESCFQSGDSGDGTQNPTSEPQSGVVGSTRADTHADPVVLGSSVIDIQPGRNVYDDALITPETHPGRDWEWICRDDKPAGEPGVEFLPTDADFFKRRQKAWRDQRRAWLKERAKQADGQPNYRQKGSI
jgi:hypothetical protein